MPQEPIKTVGAAILDQVAPPSSTPAKTAPSFRDTVKGVIAVLWSSGFVAGVIAVAEQANFGDHISNPTIGAIVGGLISIAAVIVRQYGGGPSPKPPAGYR